MSRFILTVASIMSMWQTKRKVCGFCDGRQKIDWSGALGTPPFTSFDVYGMEDENRSFIKDVAIS